MKLGQQKSTSNPFAFSAQYQQKTSPTKEAFIEDSANITMPTTAKRNMQEV